MRFQITNMPSSCPNIQPKTGGYHWPMVANRSCSFDSIKKRAQLVLEWCQLLQIFLQNTFNQSNSLLVNQVFFTIGVHFIDTQPDICWLGRAQSSLSFGRTCCVTVPSQEWLLPTLKNAWVYPPGTAGQLWYPSKVRPCWCSVAGGQTRWVK